MTATGIGAELAALRRRVEICEAILAIGDLKAHYAELVDRRFARGQVVGDQVLEALAEQIALLFTDDAVWDGGPALGRATGRPEIAARLRRPTLVFSRHFFVQPRIEVDGEHASGRWDLLCPCRTPEGTSYWMAGVEDDTYRKVDGNWLHTSMQLTTVVMAPVDQGWDRIFH